MEYNVGQVIYLLDTNRNAVLPARIFEQVTKKTIEGEEEAFFVEVPGSTNLLNLSDFDGLVFTDTDSAKNHLFETLKNNINSLVDKAYSDAVEKWGDPNPISKPKRKRGRPKKEEKPTSLVDEGTLVDLGDGRVGRLKS